MISEIKYLTALHIEQLGTLAIGEPILVRDRGLMLSAVARPQTSMFGQDAYPDLFEKAAALLHSLARNHAFQDGNRRVAWTATVVFLRVNGHPMIQPLDVDKAERLALEIARGLVDVPRIAAELRTFVG